MFKRFSIFIFFLILSRTVISQTGWQSWERIYDDEYVVVELQFYYSGNSCDDDGKQFKYRTRLTGRYRSYPLYLNWKMNYLDCNHNLFYQQVYAELWKPGGGKADSSIAESLDNRFQASALIQPFYDLAISQTKKYDAGLMSRSYSVEPTGIDTLTVNSLTSLTVTGGYLGVEAAWCWHKKSCKGELIGKGKTIKVKPEETTTYFVRAEGQGCITYCARVTVKGRVEGEAVTITNKSIAPSRIISPRFVCRGDTAMLIISKGFLERGSEWVWYTGDTWRKRVGIGDSIFVVPLRKTTYYVRAEGELDLTEFTGIEVPVFEKSSEQFSIVYKGKPEVCEGQKVEFEVDNFVPDDNGVWNWYMDSCGGTPVDSGAVVEFHPLRTTTYYLRRDGVCNPSNCTSYTIHVNKNSDIKNARIVVPDTVFKGKKTTLSVTGGILGKDANWNWYKDSCLPDKFLGSGNSIMVKMRKPTKYFTRASGLCNETQCIEIKIKPVKSPRKHIIRDKINYLILLNQ